MVKDKVKFSLWLSPEIRKEVEYCYREDNCASQSEFIEKAIKFYSGYIHAQKASDYLPRVLSEVLEGKFAVIKRSWAASCSSIQLKRISQIIFFARILTSTSRPMSICATAVFERCLKRMANLSLTMLCVSRKASGKQKRPFDFSTR